MKSENIKILVTEEFKKEVQKVCSQDSKTMTSYITDLILEDFKKRGLRDGKNKV